jgi:hypothetical protein
MKNKDTLKKHHFWILFGLVPLFVLIAVLVISGSVGGAIERRDKEIKDEEAKIKQKSNPKPNSLIEKMGELVKLVESKQDGLWKGSYTPQKYLYTWPDSYLLKDIERKKLKFGDRIPNDRDEYEEFKKNEVYLARYRKLAESVAPTTFLDGWEKILRHVSAFSAVKLTSDQIWLLMEDIWVQESLLEAVRAVDAQMAEFTRVKFERDGVVIDDPGSDKDKKDAKGPSDPLRRKFKSRTWEIELEVVKEGNKHVVKGALINTTDKLQLLGVGNTMVLRVWLQPGDKRSIQPFEFKIGGEFVPGAGATKSVKDKDGNVKEVPANILQIPGAGDHGAEDHIVPPGMQVDEIVAVEQVFDSRTVPIRRIDYVALGFPDSRNAASPLFPPFGTKEDPVPAADPKGGGPGLGGGGGGGGGSDPSGLTTSGRMGGGGGPGPNMGMGGASSASVRKTSGGGTVAEVLDGNKKRYIERPSEQVRRLPIGVGVIVDQAFLQDVLIAFANSPIRFQITQVTWNRFRGSLGSESDSGSVGIPNQSTGGGIQQGGHGNVSSDFGFGSGGMKGPPAGGKTGPAAPPGGAMSGGPGGSMGGGYGSSTTSTVSESQLTSGLIELKIYGIVNLYTSPEAPVVDPNAAKDKDGGEPKKDGGEPKKDGGEPKKDKEPKDKEPKKESEPKKDKDPKDKEPMPATPTTTDPKTSKM